MDDSDLLKRLKKLRSRKAADWGMAPSEVFSAETLRRLVKRRPQNMAELERAFVEGDRVRPSIVRQILSITKRSQPTQARTDGVPPRDCRRPDEFGDGPGATRQLRTPERRPRLVVPLGRDVNAAALGRHVADSQYLSIGPDGSLVIDFDGAQPRWAKCADASWIVASAEERARIQQACEWRGVKRLVHFTRIENVPQILELGLTSRGELSRQEKPFTPADQARSDGVPGWPCLSVTFPNYKMFFAKRQEHGGGARWAVLGVDAAALWSSTCLFFGSNAAGAAFYHRDAGSLASMGAFSEMFADRVDGKDRELLQLPNYYTTDPQAEVRAIDGVDVGLITNVAFESAADLQVVEERVGSWPHRVRPSVVPKLFGPRIDYRHW